MLTISKSCTEKLKYQTFPTSKKEACVFQLGLSKGYQFFKTESQLWDYFFSFKIWIFYSCRM